MLATHTHNPVLLPPNTPISHTHTERESHAYEGEGVGRRESLRGDDLPPAHAADERAPGAAPQHGK